LFHKTNAEADKGQTIKEKDLSSESKCIENQAFSPNCENNQEYCNAAMLQRP
jgi:hypothetical protein